MARTQPWPGGVCEEGVVCESRVCPLGVKWLPSVCKKDTFIDNQSLLIFGASDTVQIQHLSITYFMLVTVVGTWDITNFKTRFLPWRSSQT